MTACIYDEGNILANMKVEMSLCIDYAYSFVVSDAHPGGSFHFPYKKTEVAYDDGYYFALTQC